MKIREQVKITNVPEKLHIEARIKAIKEGRSFSDVVRELLAEYVKRPVKNPK